MPGSIHLHVRALAEDGCGPHGTRHPVAGYFSFEIEKRAGRFTLGGLGCKAQPLAIRGTNDVGGVGREGERHTIFRTVSLAFSKSPG